MTTRRELTQRAHKTALEVRRSHRVGLTDAISVYDLAERMGVEVRFVDVPSMEGMYVRERQPVILISTHRPSGRQAFTCAHELGHHVFEHGTHIDELIAENKSRSFQPEELLADVFAGALLMPKSAVIKAFDARGLQPETSAPQAIYSIAEWFGAGYTTLVHHLSSTLSLLSKERAPMLLKSSPKSLRSLLLGGECPTHLVPVDFNWANKPADIQVEDLLLAPEGTTVEGRCIKVHQETAQGLIVQAIAPGVGRITHSGNSWSLFVRVSRRQYIGRSIFRHLEDEEDA